MKSLTWLFMATLVFCSFSFAKDYSTTEFKLKTSIEKIDFESAVCADDFSGQPQIGLIGIQKDCNDEEKIQNFKTDLYLVSRKKVFINYIKRYSLWKIYPGTKSNKAKKLSLTNDKYLKQLINLKHLSVSRRT